MGKCFKNIRKEKEKARSVGTSSNKNLDHPARNALDADLKILLSQNVPSQLKTSRKDASLKNLWKKLIVHATTVMMKMTLTYRHLWHECLMKKNAKVNIMAIVRN